MSTESDVYELADAYVERFAALDPLARHRRGHHRARPRDDRLLARRHRRARRARPRHAARRSPPPTSTNDADRIAADALRERLELALEEHDAGERLRDIRILGSPVQGVRMVFDLMPRDTEEQWQTIAERLALVPQGLSSIETALTEGVQQGIVAARRQAVKCAQQADVWGGVDPSTPPFFLTLVDELRRVAASPTRLSPPPRRARDPRHRGVRVDGARTSSSEYAPHAAEHDPVGRERYALYAPRLQRHRARPRRDVRVGLGGALPHRGTRCARSRERILPGAAGRRGDRAPRDRPEPRHRGRRRVPALDPGAARHARSPSSTARTSTSPSRCSGSRR